MIIKDTDISINMAMDGIDGNDEKEDKNDVLDIRNTALVVMDVTSTDIHKMNSLDEDNTKLEAILAKMRSIDSDQSVRTPLTSDHDISRKVSHFGSTYAEDSMYALQEGYEHSMIISHNRMHSANMSSDTGIAIDGRDSEQEVNLTLNMDVIGRNTSIIL